MAGVLLEVGNCALGVDQVQPDALHLGAADPGIRDDKGQVLAELAPHVRDQVDQIGFVISDTFLGAVVPPLMPSEARDLVVPSRVLGELGAEIAQHVLHRAEHVGPHVTDLATPTGYGGWRPPVGLQTRPAGRDLDEQYILLQRVADDMSEAVLRSVPIPFAEADGVTSLLGVTLRQLSGILLVLEDLNAGVDTHVIADEPLAVAVNQWVGPLRPEGFGHRLDRPGQASDSSRNLTAIRRRLRLILIVLRIEPIPSLAMANHVGLPGENKDLDWLIGC